MMKDLPSHWATKTLGEVCEIEKIQNTNRSLPFVGLENIESNTAILLGYFKGEEIKSNTFYFNNKHVLYGRLRAYLNKALLPDFEGQCSTEIFPLKPQKSLDRKFLLYWLLESKNAYYINKTSTGTRMPRANMNVVLGFPIPLPPLEEQKAIVKVLDNAFERLDKALASAEEARQLSQELWQSALNKALSPKDGWATSLLSDVAKSISVPNKIPKKAFLREGQYPIISQEQDFINGYWNNEKDVIKLSKPVVIFGDHTKNVKFIDFNFVYGADGIQILEPKNSVEPKFLYYLIHSANLRDLGYARHFRLLKQYEFSIPPLEEQKAIVAQLDVLHAKIKKLDNDYQNKIEMIKTLKASLLNHAFTGKLTLER